MPTKPLQKLEKKDLVAQIANIKSTNCFLQTNSPNITLANKYSCMVFESSHDVHLYDPELIYRPDTTMFAVATKAL